MSPRESGGRSAPTADLVAKAKARDRDAAGELYALYAGKIRSFIRGRLNNRLRARMGSADVSQDAFLAAFDKLAQFKYRGPGSFLRWVKRIAEMRILTLERQHLKAAKRDAHKEAQQRLGSTSRDMPIDASAPSPSSQFGRAERSEMVQELLEQLPPDYARMLRLVFWGRLKIKEAAARMGRSSGAGEKLLARALAKCRALARQRGLRTTD